MSSFLLYIDPGTGSMLFSIVIGLTVAVVFALRTLAVKLKFLLTGGRARKADITRIPFVLYSDHKRYWNVFRPVCDEAEKRGLDLVYYTQSPDDPALSALYAHVKAEFIGEGNRGFVRLNFLKADIVLATTPGLGVYQWKRSPDVRCYVHILHQIDSPLRYHTFGLVNYGSVYPKMALFGTISFALGSSMIGFISMPFGVPQSSSVMMTSCDTSTSLRVR